MSYTSKIDLAYLAPTQAQKHVTVNEALRQLDIIVQLNVLDVTHTAPPEAPSAGDTYLIASSATGDWLDKDTQIAAWIDEGWIYTVPKSGWQAYVIEETVVYAFDGTLWEKTGFAEEDVNGVSKIGINATADSYNRLTLKSEAALFDHDGSGTQIKLNKNSEYDTAALVYQNTYSGRAELGLTGDDNFHFKVSADGSTFLESLLIDRYTGKVTFPQNSIDGLKPSYLYCDTDLSEIENWYEIFAWSFSGDYTSLSMIFDITHRNSLTHHILRLRGEFRETTGPSPYFTDIGLEITGTSEFQDGEEYLLVADDASYTLKLYHKRSSAAYPYRFASVRHVAGDPVKISFTHTNTQFGTTEPVGDTNVKLTSLTSSA